MANNTPPPNWPKGEPYAPYIPSGPSTPGTDYDKNPTKNWYPNGQYGWDDPYLNGDAQTRNERYPHYWSYGDPDPNWRPSFYGETPPWNRNPNDTSGSANTQKGDWFGNTMRDKPKETPAEKERRLADYRDSDAVEAGRRQADRDSDAAFWAAGGKKGHLSNGRTFAIYPPGWTGQRKWDEFNFDPEKDFKSGPLKFQWDQAPAGTKPGGTPAPAPGPTSGPTAAPPPAPGPTSGPTAAPPPAPDPAPPANQPWQDSYGNTHYDPRDSGPKQSPEEIAYWQAQAKTNPMTWRTQRVPNESDPNFGTMRAIRTIKGPDGKAHAAWDEGSTWYKQASDEQKAWGANTITDFNKQFDPTNAVNPANDKLYKLQAMKPELRDRIMANAGQNTPAAKAMMAQWGDAINQYKAQSQPAPGPTQPPPGPTQPPPASVQGQPQQPGQPPPANMGDARFHNGNPYYNGKGNLRMPFRNAIAGQMMSDMQSQQQPATSWNMGGQNGQAMFGTQNQYSYWPQGGQQGYGMGAPSSNPYQQSYGPPQTMNYYGGQQGYGGGGQYGGPPMPNYGSGTSGGKPYQGGGQGDVYWGNSESHRSYQEQMGLRMGRMGGGNFVTGAMMENMRNSKAQELALTPEQRAARDKVNAERAMGIDSHTDGPYGYGGNTNVYLGGQQGYGGGRGYGEPPMPNYSQNSGGQESYGPGSPGYRGNAMPANYHYEAQPAWARRPSPYDPGYDMTGRPHPAPDMDGEL